MLFIRKLEFYREGHSEKHLRDIAAMLTESTAEIDQDLLSKHIESLGLQSQWQAAKQLSSHL